MIPQLYNWALIPKVTDNTYKMSFLPSLTSFGVASSEGPISSRSGVVMLLSKVSWLLVVECLDCLFMESFSLSGALFNFSCAKNNFVKQIAIGTLVS